MALRTDRVGVSTSPRTETVEPARAQAYAAATNDPTPAYRDGTYAPLVFGVVPTWAAMLEALADVVPPEVMLQVVHGEEDMWFHQPLAPGMQLTSTASVHSVRVGGSGTRAVVRIDAVDEYGEPVLEIYNTAFIRGFTDAESTGPDKPDHTFFDAARDHEVGEYSVHLDSDQTFRYAEASGDHMPIHLDDNVAKSVGLPGIIIHGLCTMAVCSQAVVHTVAGGDPARLKRLAVRFAKNVLPDSDVTVSIYDAGIAESGNHAYAFEAHSRGELVISNGRAEVAQGS